MDCVFCQIIAGQAGSEIFYQDDEVIVFRDHVSRAPIHLQICPKKHYENFMAAPPEVHRKLADTVKLVSERLGERGTDFRVMINNGRGAGQIVFHLHYHFLAGW